MISGGNSFVLSDGDSLQLSYTLEDSTSLLQYRIYNVLAAGEEAIDSNGMGIAYNAWKYLWVESLNVPYYSGSHYIKTNSFNTLPGLYYCIVQASDLDFNLGSDTVLVRVVNTIDTVKPTFHFTTPYTNQDIFPLDTVEVLGLMSDLISSGLSGKVYRYDIRWINPDDTYQNLGSGMKPSGDTLKVTYTVPESALPGEHRIQVKLRDCFNNLDSVSRSVIVY